jgi:site-specific DNA recombinase
MKKAAIYTRVSTPDQAHEGESLEMQKDRLKSYAKAQGWEVCKIYEDGGYSGGSTDRPAFQEMLADAKQRKFDVVLVYKIDRFSRSILDFHNNIKLLELNNVSFFSLTQNFDTSTSTGRLLLNILIDFANFEREINVDRAIDSFSSRFAKGFHSGQAPYGYKRENGNNLTVNMEQAEKVKKIFILANQGVTTRAIAKQLTLGVDRVKTILDNPIYTGNLAPRRDKHGYHELDISKWIKGHHEAIIPIELFFEVQKKYKKGQRTTKYISIFQKLVYCPYCQHNYSFYARKNKKEVKYFYRCIAVSDGGKSCNRTIEEDIIEEILLENIGRLFDTSISEQSTTIDIDEEIRRIDARIEKILDIDLEVLPKDKLEKKIKQLQNEKIELLNQQKTTTQKRNINQYFKKIEDVYPYANREYRKRLWNIIIQRITIYDNSIEVLWNNGKKTKHKKRPLRNNSLGMVREGGVMRSTQLLNDLIKEFIKI